MKRTKRRQTAVLALSVLALTLIAPWALGQDPDPLTEIRRRADQGDADTQFLLGLRYANGEGVPENDAEAVKWYRLAAEQGHANAQYFLGAMYANGDGVPENDAEAVKWYRLGRRAGSRQCAQLTSSVPCTPTVRACRKTMPRP